MITIRSINGEVLTHFDNDVPNGNPYFEPVMTDDMESLVSSFSFSVPLQLADTEYLTGMNQVLTYDRQGDLRLFIISDVYEDWNTTNGVVKVDCEDVSITEMNNIVVNPFDAKDFNEALTKTFKNSGWKFKYAANWKEVVHDTFILEDYTNMRDVLAQLKDTYECQFKFMAQENEYGEITRVVEVFKSVGNDNGKYFYYNRDLLGIERDISFTDVKTAIHPYYVGYNGKVYTLANFAPAHPDPDFSKDKESPLIVNKSAHAEYDDGNSYRIMPYKTEVQGDPELVYREAIEELKKHAEPIYTYTVNALLLQNMIEWEGEDIDLGDTVWMKERVGNRELGLEARVVAYEYHEDDPSADKVTFSNFKEIDTRDVEELSNRIFFAYANSADGHLDFSTDDSVGKAYMGVYTSTVTQQSTDPDTYKWTKIKGEDGNSAPTLSLTTSQQVMKFKPDGTPDGDQTILFTALKQNSTEAVEWEAIPYKGDSAQPAITLEGTGDTRTLSSANWDKTWTRVQVTVTMGALKDIQTVVQVADGATGASGKAIVGFVTNESTTFAASTNGTVSDYTQGNGKFVIYEGTKEVTSGVLYAKESNVGINLVIDATTGEYTVANMTQDQAQAVVKATYKGVTITKFLSFAKSKQGAKGDKGDTGRDGIAGKDGVGLKSTTVTYAASTSGTTAPSTGWQTQVPTVAPDNFLWTRTVWTYTDNTSETGYSVAKMGKDGAKGNDGIAGKDGVGIADTLIEYAVSTSGTTRPTSGWSTTIPTTPQGQYLWTRTTWTYTDKTTEQGFTVARQGEKGDKGDQGIAGPKGADGKTQYTHIAYADNASGGGFSQNPTGKAYIGMYVDFEELDSSDPMRYAWSLIKGADGEKGVAGPKGEDGRTPYFHTAYAWSADGTDRFTTVYPKENLYSKSNLTKIIFMDGTYGGGSGNYTGAILPVSAGKTYTITSHDRKQHDRFSLFFTLEKPAYYMPNTVINRTNGTEPMTWTATEDGYLGIQLAQSITGVPENIRLKVELGDQSTIYTPNPSEDYANAYPTYTGTYTDYTEADSTNPADYTWVRILGEAGQDGKDGIAGKDGIGIKSTAITYALADSGTTAPTSGWTATVPTLIKGKYLWTKSEWTYTDNSNETGYSVTYVAKDGNNGTDGIAGKDGVGIKTTLIEYAVNTSGTTRPASGWSTTIPTVPAGQYLWTRTTWTYTDNTTEQGYSVARQGNNGQNGADGKDGAPAKLLSLQADSYVMKFDTNGNIISGQTISLSAIVQNMSGTTTWLATPYIGTAAQPPLTLAGSGNTRTLSGSQWGKTVTKVVVKVTLGDFEDTIIINKLQDGAKGQDGADGRDGVAGKDGVGLKSTAITYAGSANGTTPPSTGWQTQVPTVPAGQFLWTRTIWTYTDNSNETGYSVAKMGQDGAKGNDGIAGKDGVGIKTTKIEYAVNTSGTVRPTTGWSTTIPNTPQGQYLWTRTTWTYTDNTTEQGYSVARMGQDGAKGNDGIAGKDGVGLRSTSITYAGSENGTTPPDTGWNTQVPTVPAGQYLWTKTVWTYTDSSSETGYSVARMGQNGNNGKDGIAGKDGVGIKTTVIEYAVNTSGTTRPTSGWSTSIPTVPQGQYLWTRTTWTYTDNTTEQGFTVARQGSNGANGTNGTNGANAISAFLSNETVSLPANAAGVVSSFATARGTMMVYEGLNRVTSGVTFSLGAHNNTTATVDASGNFAVTAMTADSATVVINATYKGQTLSKTFSLSKAKQGVQGVQGTMGIAFYSPTEPTGATVTNGATWFKTKSSTDDTVIGIYTRKSGAWKQTPLASGTLAVEQLSAISANIGNVTAGNLTGVKITGASFINPFDFTDQTNNHIQGTTEISNSELDISGTANAGTAGERKFHTTVAPMYFEATYSDAADNLIRSLNMSSSGFILNETGSKVTTSLSSGQFQSIDSANGKSVITSTSNISITDSKNTASMSPSGFLYNNRKNIQIWTGKGDQINNAANNSRLRFGKYYNVGWGMTPEDVPFKQIYPYLWQVTRDIRFAVIIQVMIQDATSPWIYYDLHYGPDRATDTNPRTTTPLGQIGPTMDSGDKRINYKNSIECIGYVGLKANEYFSLDPKCTDGKHCGNQTVMSAWFREIWEEGAFS